MGLIIAMVVITGMYLLALHVNKITEKLTNMRRNDIL